jgi:hypothetical protein
MSAPTKQAHHVEIVDLQALGMRRRTEEASRVMGTAKLMLIAPNAIEYAIEASRPETNAP